MVQQTLDTHILVLEIGTLYMTRNDDDADDQDEDMNMRDMGDTLFCFALCVTGRSAQPFESDSNFILRRTS